MTYTKYDFLESFDTPDSFYGRKKDRTYTEREFVCARDIAFAQGLEQGRQEKLSENEIIMQKVIEQIHEKTAQLLTHQEQNNHRLFAELVRVTQFIVKKHAKTEAERHAGERCVSFIQKIFSFLLEVPNCLIKVHPELVERVQAELSARHIKITGDESITPGDCFITWDKGGASFCFEDYAFAIEKTLEEWIQSRAGEMTTNVAHLSTPL